MYARLTFDDETTCMELNCPGIVNYFVVEVDKNLKVQITCLCYEHAKKRGLKN